MQNKWEKLFEEFLDVTEFTLVHYEYGRTDPEDEEKIGYWGLYDRQGANLGEIESDVFTSASEIIDRMSTYINDYFYRDLEEEAQCYEVQLPDDNLLIQKYGTKVYWGGAEYWLAIKQELKDKNKDFLEAHQFDFDILEMIAHHGEDIELNNISHEEG